MKRQIIQRCTGLSKRRRDILSQRVSHYQKLSSCQAHSFSTALRTQQAEVTPSKQAGPDTASYANQRPAKLTEIVAKVQHWLLAEPEYTRNLPTQEEAVDAVSPAPIPSHLSPAALITNHIATAASTASAQRATMQAAMAHLSRRPDTTHGFDALNAHNLRFGKVVRFRDGDEKARAVALAQEHAADAAARMSAQKGKVIRSQTIAFEQVPKKYREELVAKVVRGKYDEGAVIGTGDKGEAQRVDERLFLNDTFTKKPGREFGAVVKRLFRKA